MTFQNVAIVGNLGNNTNNVMGLGIENAAPSCIPNSAWVYFDNTLVTNFQNHLVYSYNFTGVIRGYNLILWNSGTSTSNNIGGFPPSCMVLDSFSNPIRFYNLVTAKCYNGTTLNGMDGVMVDGFTSFSNAGYGFSVTGTPSNGSTAARAGASIIMYNAEANNNGASNFYFDQQGGTQTVQCYWCRSQKTQTPSTADVEIGADAKGLAFSAEGFQFTDVTNGGNKNQNFNILFDGPPGAGPCQCTAALQGTQSPTISQILTNEPQLITGPSFLLGAPPILDGNPMTSSAGWGNGIVVPQGRLTLTQGTPVMSADVSNGTTVYYTDMVGQHLPIFNGSNLVAQNVHSYFMQTIGTTTASSLTISNVGDINELATIIAAGATVTVTGPDIHAGATVYSATAGTTFEQTNSGLTTTLGSAVITGFLSTSGITPGWGVTGSDLPNGSYVIAVGPGSVTINQPALSTDTGGASVSFYSGGTVILNTGSTVTASDVGTQLVFTATIGDLQLPLDSNSSDTGYQEHANLFDLFVALNPTDQVPTLCTGPSWSNSTPGSSARGTGTSPSNVISFMGVWVNKNVMTCRFGNTPTANFQCPNKQCTYVGTMLATVDGGASMVMNPTGGAGGSTNTCLCVYNAYNQTDVAATSKDSNTQYVYNNVAWRSMDASSWALNAASNAVAYVDGLGYAAPSATLVDALQSAMSTLQAIGIDFNATSGAPKIIGANANNQFNTVTVNGRIAPNLGLNYVQAMESGGAMVNTKFGNGNNYQALTVHMPN